MPSSPLNWRAFPSAFLWLARWRSRLSPRGNLSPLHYESQNQSNLQQYVWVNLTIGLNDIISFCLGHVSSLLYDLWIEIHWCVLSTRVGFDSMNFLTHQVLQWKVCLVWRWLLRTWSLAGSIFVNVCQQPGTLHSNLLGGPGALFRNSSTCLFWVPAMGSMSCSSSEAVVLGPPLGGERPVNVRGETISEG